MPTIGLLERAGSEFWDERVLISAWPTSLNWYIFSDNEVVRLFGGGLVARADHDDAGRAAHSWARLITKVSGM